MMIRKCTPLAVLLMFFLIGCSQESAQPETEPSGLPSSEIWLFDLDDGFSLSSPVNISENPGRYSNQPYFVDNDTIYFTSERNGKTDLVKYTVSENKRVWLTDHPASEFSPQPVPGRNAVSAVRLYGDGTQYMAITDLDTGESEKILDGYVPGYFIWHDPQTVAAFILGEPHRLMVFNLEDGSVEDVGGPIGRSLHRIPGTDFISYIHKADDEWTIRALFVDILETKDIAPTLPEREDLAWAPNGTLLMGDGKSLYTFVPGEDYEWQRAPVDESMFPGNISRMAVSPDGRRLAIVFTGIE